MASEGTAPQNSPSIIRHETVVIQTPDWYYLEFENGKTPSIHATTFSIGRDESNDLVYDNLRISKLHCMLTRGASGEPPEIKDTSTNGILVDGRKVCKGAAVPLKWGQRVELIPFELKGEIRDYGLELIPKYRDNIGYPRYRESWLSGIPIW
jgi:predicted component of type VI protein secretion system